MNDSKGTVWLVQTAISRRKHENIYRVGFSIGNNNELPDGARVIYLGMVFKEHPMVVCNMVIDQFNQCYSSTEHGKRYFEGSEVQMCLLIDKIIEMYS